MAWGVAPSRPLSRAQALSGIGDGIRRTEPLPGGIQQMHTPGVGIAMRLRSQQVAIRRVGIDAGQYGLSTVEDLIVQADADAGQVLLTVDDASLLGCRLKHIVDGADADGHTQQVTQELNNAAIRAVADQRQPDDHLAQPGPGDRQLKQHRIVPCGRRESVIQRRLGFVGLLIDEFAAHPMPDCQIADCRRPRQHQNSQVLTLTLGQPCGAANASIHSCTTTEKSGCRHPPRQRQLSSRWIPSLNHALTSVAATPLDYFDSSYSYGAGGRFERATEAQTVNPLPVGSEVKSRDVRYVYGGADPEQVTALTNVVDAQTYANYSYDAAGNQIARTYPASGESWEYVYDGKDQLRRATRKLNGVVKGSEEYWYDQN